MPSIDRLIIDRTTTAEPQIGEEAQQSVIRKVFQQVAQRPDSFCNYLEGRCVRPSVRCCMRGVNE